MQKIIYLIFALLCAVVHGAWAQTEVSTENGLRNALNSVTTVSIKLTQDIPLSEKLEIANGKTVTIDLNGHKISRSLSANENYGMVIYVNGGNMTINDSSGNNSGSIEGGRSYNGAGILCESGSTLTINSGTFTNNDVSRTDNGDHGRGGAIFMNPNTTLTVTGGVFDNCSAYNGGAIYIDGGTATVSGATFTNCQVTGDGGAIYNKGTATVSNCTFTGNKAAGVSGSAGGGIWNSDTSTLSLTGCTITGNQCKGNGGGINIHGNATITGCTITGNTAGSNGGGIYVDASGKTVTLSGSNTIQSNTDGTNGGGIYFHAVQTINMSGKPIVTDNTGNDGCTNNLYLRSSDVITCGTFESGTSISVSLENYDRAFTNGYGSNNSGHEASDYFSADVIGATLSLNNGEAYISTNSGVLYVECSWEGGNTDGHVVKTTKIATGVNGFHIETDQNLYDGWYQFVGEHEYSDRIAIHGDVKFILYDGCNIEFKKGIHIDKGKTLTIYAQSGGTGKLRCTGDGGSASNGDAAIGGNNEVVGGSLVIHGGYIYAYPYHNDAAGIGGGDGESGMQSVTIWDGTVEAKGRSGGAGIGGGRANSTLPTITIYGGSVTATGAKYGAGIGGGEDRGNGVIKIFGGTVTASGGSEGELTEGGAAGIGGGSGGGVDNPIYIYGGTINATGGDGGAGIGTGESGDTENVSLKAPIHIYGGTVTAKGGEYSAGIGGGKHVDMSAAITIYDGTINATGGRCGAGIGTGISGNCSDIIINGGTVTAKGGKQGPGIGTGYGNDKDRITGTITINGGYVEAISPGASAASIGGGYQIPGSTVNIYGGTVKAIYSAEIEDEKENRDNYYLANNYHYIGRGGHGKAGVNLSKGKINFASNYKVSKNGSTVSASERESTCQTGANGKYGYVLVEACDHSGGITYNQKDGDDGDYYHHVNCTIGCCEGYDEAHIKGDDGLCTKCGRSLPTRTLTFYEANEVGDGYASTGTEYYVREEAKFTFPECSNVPSKTVFVGWRLADSTPDGIEVTYNEVLVRAGEEFTLPIESTDRIYYARYKRFNFYGSGGSGTQADPFIIATTDDLDELATAVNDGQDFKNLYFIQTADLDYATVPSASAENNYTPVGNECMFFDGTFDGAGHTIKGISISNENNYQGLFGYIGPNGTVKNVTLDQSTIIAWDNIGGIAAHTRGRIENCHVTNDVSIQATSYNAGGVVGMGSLGNDDVHSQVKGCTSAASVVSDGANVGGIAGSSTYCDLENCIYHGSTVTGWYNVGAIVGLDYHTNNITSNYYVPQDGLPNGIGGDYGESSSDATGATKAYNVESGTDSLTLDYGSATTRYEYDGIEVYSFDQGNDETATGKLYQGKLYTSSGTKVTFTPEADQVISNLEAINTQDAEDKTDITDNSDGTYTLTMPAHNLKVKADLTPYIVTLHDTQENTATIEGHHSHIADVTITGRTLYKDGSWNTLCLPFDLEDFTDTPFEGATVMELGNSDACTTGFDASTGTLTLDFVDADRIEAGHAYIVKWETTDDPIVNPVFYSVIISNEDPADQKVVSKDGYVSFFGNYDPTPLSGEYMTMLYLDSDNMLSHPDKNMSINAFRAYFQLEPSLGDVNSDGDLSVTDLMLLVNYILGQENDNFNVEKGDINGDGNISVSDVTMLVNMILHTGTNLKVVVNGADGITFGGSYTGTGSARAGESTLWNIF